MSLELGGRADKFGNDFERFWVVSLALRILDGEATNLRWEPPGPAGKGIDLTLTLNDGLVEAYQCKIENGSNANWTVTALNRAGVIGAIQNQLDRVGVDRFVFVSRDPCRTLGDLCARASKSNNDPVEFTAFAINTRTLKPQFEILCKAWKLNSKRPDEVLRAMLLLQRVRFERGIWEPSERLGLERTARLFAHGKGSEIVRSITSFLSDSLGNDVNATDLRSHLRKEGHPPRDCLEDPTVASSVERLQSDFRSSLLPVFPKNRLIARSETDEVWKLLRNSDGPRLVFLHGRAGHGKSGVLLELVDRLIASSVPFLPVRLDVQRPEGGEEAFRQALGLPDHPVRCLSAIAGSKQAVLIVDQLDALRWTAAHSEAAWEICREIVELALARKTIRVVIACRTFDLNDDRRFKAWEAEKQNDTDQGVKAMRVEVGTLKDQDVKRFVEPYGGEYDRLSPRQQQLLQIPFCLFLWWTLRDESPLEESFSSATDLMQLFWRSRRKKLTDECSISETQLNEVLNEVIGHLDRDGRQDFPSVFFDRFAQLSNALHSLSIVHACAPGRLKFVHQSFLDYLVAERVTHECLTTNTSPLDWIRGHEQSLFRREQLRQLLLLLSDQSPNTYLELLSGLFSSGNIRFHLRHLALSVLKSADIPTDAEYSLLKSLLDESSWRKHVLSNVVLGHSAWTSRVINAGVVAKWLSSGREDEISDALWILRSTPKDSEHVVESALSSYASGNDAVWAARIDRILRNRIVDESEWLFDWRLRRTRSGNVSVALYMLEAAVDRLPDRVVQLVGAWFEHRLDSIEAEARTGKRDDRRQNYNREHGQWRKISGRVNAAGAPSWSLLIGCLRRTLAVSRQLHRARIKNSKRKRRVPLFLPPGHLWELSGKLREMNGILALLLTSIGREHIRLNFPKIWDDLTSIEVPRSRCANRLICNVLRGAPVEFADDIIKSLSENPRGS